MSRMFPLIICLLGIVSACGGLLGDRSASGELEGSGDGDGQRRTSSGLVEGKDYVVLKRVRLLDEMGFDQPVEAMSVLVPNGWRTEGGVRWKGVNECRGEMITWQMSATSPDGAIRFTVLPVRSFTFFQDQMLQQGALAAQQQGGCRVNAPFDASQYLEHIAQAELGGASVSNIRSDESLLATLEKIIGTSNATSRQYGTGMNHTGSAVYGTLTWPDGTKGLARIAVSVATKQGNDMFTGAPNGFATTTVFFQTLIRYPAEREAEALKTFGTITASYRENPIWQQAKDAFLTRLGNMEHAGRMERLRLQGEQSAAYAKAQSDAADARMRNWEQAQASSDANQHRFIQTIREVETWKSSEGKPVELSAGYSHGWSRPDGSYILTDNSNFDPAVEFQQNWERMEKPRQ